MSTHPLRRILVHFPSLRQHHLSRLRACEEHFRGQSEVIGFATFANNLSTNHQGARPVICHTVRESADRGRLSRDELLRSIWFELERLRPDAVAVDGCSEDDSLAILLWCRKNDVPAILLSDQWEAKGARGKGRRFIESLLIRQFGSAIVAGSKHRKYLEMLGMQKRLIFSGYATVDNKHFRDGAESVRNGTADLSAYRDLPSRFWLAGGQFSTRKNFDGLLDAYAAYRSEIGPSARDLVLMGDGSLKRALCEKAISLGCGAHIHFVGKPEYSMLPYLYGLAELYICPSRFEPWGLAINEAMAAGLPIAISNQAGAAFDLVREEVNGTVFDPLHFRNITDALVKVSRSAVRFKMMGQSSQRMIEAYAPECFAFSLDAALAAAIANAPAVSKSLLSQLFIELSFSYQGGGRLLGEG